jgi:hypothetical protein
VAGTSTLSGGAAHVVLSLTEAERQAAHNVLARLRHSERALGSHLSSQLESATVASGSSLSLKPSSAGLGASTLLSARGSDTLMGGKRSAPLKPVFSVGSDTVIGGSVKTLGQTSDVARGAQHFSLTADTINVLGATAAGIQAGHHQHAGTMTHTITLADKTTIKISGLTAHDIAKLHR